MGVVALAAGLGVALVLSSAALITAASGPSGDALAAAPVAAADAGDLPAQVAVELDEMTISPGQLEIAAGGTLEITNTGSAPHDLVVEGTDLATPMLDAGATATLALDELDAGTYLVFCSVAGHRAAGMEATLVVGGGDAEVVAVDHGAEQAPAAPDFAVFDPNAAPEDGFEARDARLAPAPEGQLHELELRVSEIQGEVAPGTDQELWTFNGTVPGPVIRGKVGDVFRITFINDGSMPHSLDFHSSKVAPDVEMRSIDPGEQLVYEFEAKHAGAWMYHCGTAPVLHHTGNGQYGVMIIDPPDLPAVDHEYVFVQSEFYLGPDGEPGDYAKMLAEEPDIVAFNGYANQYVHDPITAVAADERVRVWLLNAGPSEDSTFHVIGSIFDTVWKEGSYRLDPRQHAPGGAQALDLQPSQGGFVEFTFDVDGTYTFVSHQFSQVPRGAAGLFVVGDAAVDGDVAH
ncbi:multicopper oxidase domain-containing protein [Nitriliruptoraceae bacterium ZYF776]|nr:multicopper oxidase domain-containing protein [Profundirhabdus halotolerans]